jgi:hypothetical protein
MLYCFPLALGIYFSMQRQQTKRGRLQQADSGMACLGQLRRIAGVWTFFSLINYWNIKTDQSIVERLWFFLALFGL